MSLKVTNRFDFRASKAAGLGFFPFHLRQRIKVESSKQRRRSIKVEVEAVKQWHRRIELEVETAKQVFFMVLILPSSLWFFFLLLFGSSFPFSFTALCSWLLLLFLVPVRLLFRLILLLF